MLGHVSTGSLLVSNAGSANISSFAEQASGQLVVLGATPTDPGTVDEFQVGPGGSLTVVGSVLVPGAAGGEGIVAF